MHLIRVLRSKCLYLGMILVPLLLAGGCGSQGTGQVELTEEYKATTNQQDKDMSSYYSKKPAKQAK